MVANKISQLSSDVLSKITLFLSLEEFFNFIFLTTKQIDASKQLIEREIIRYLIIRWSLSPYDIKFMNLAQHKYSTLKKELPYAFPMIDGISNNNLMISIHNNHACFKGQIGQGNRSVTSKTPFPHQKSQLNTIISELEIAIKNRSIEKMIKLFKSLMKMSSKEKKYFQFSTPFQYMDLKSNILRTYVTSRSIAYFEVMIQASKSAATHSNLLHRSRNNSQNNLLLQGNNVVGNTNIPECVAVGLSASAFDTNNKFPGWGESNLSLFILPTIFCLQCIYVWRHHRTADVCCCCCQLADTDVVC